MDVILEWEESSFTKEYADFKFGRKETIFYTTCTVQYSLIYLTVKCRSAVQ